jgi:hypothetical protein
MDGYLLAEVWSVVKQYIPARELQTAADQLVSVLLDQNLSSDDFNELVESDNYLRRAADEYSESLSDHQYDDDDLDQE